MSDNVNPVLVVYVNISELDDQEIVKEHMSKIANIMNIDGYHSIVVPTRDRETTIECINPSLASDEEKEDISAFMERADQAIHEFFKNKTTQ